MQWRNRLDEIDGEAYACRETCERLAARGGEISQMFTYTWGQEYDFNAHWIRVKIEADVSRHKFDVAYYDNDHIPESFIEIGSGTLPIQSYIDAANECSAADFIILEQDFTAMDEIDSIKKSMEGFRKFSGVKW